MIMQRGEKILSTGKVYELLSKSNLSINKVSLLGHGDDSDVFLADDLYVIKVPKRAEVKASQEREFLLYDYLENLDFDFEIPKTAVSRVTPIIESR